MLSNFIIYEYQKKTTTTNKSILSSLNILMEIFSTIIKTEFVSFLRPIKIKQLCLVVTSWKKLILSTVNLEAEKRFKWKI